MNTKIKVFPLRLTAEFHKAIKSAAYRNETSMHGYILQAIQGKLEKEGEK